MAEELTMSGVVRFRKGSIDISLEQLAKRIDVSGTKFIKTVQAIGTTEEAIGKGEVGTPGIMIVRNLDTTNFVTIRPATGVTTGAKIKAGEFAIFRPSGSAPYAIADTAAVNIEYLLIED